MPRTKFFLHLFIAFLSLLCSVPAFACAICAPSADQNTLIFLLLNADAALLAKPAPVGNDFTPVQAVKGTLPKEGIQVADRLHTAAGSEAAGSVLLLFNAGTNAWTNAGAMPVSRADWLRQLASMRPASALAPTDASWAERLALFAPDLEHSLPLAAQTAYDEIAVAPYAMMRTLKPLLDARKLSAWLQSPDLAARRSLYHLLLGFAGDQATASGLEKRILSEEASLSKADLSSMLAATIELRGNAGVEWVEQHYLQVPARTDLEVQAALLAMSVHGNDGVKVSRNRIIQAYRGFISNNPARAGFVASDLGNWGHWEFVADYMALLKTGEKQAFASRYAIVLYLMRSPSAEARNALERLRAEGFL